MNDYQPDERDVIIWPPADYDLTIARWLGENDPDADILPGDHAGLLRQIILCEACSDMHETHRAGKPCLPRFSTETAPNGECIN